jgi:ADP-ribose pyrophosphatase
MGDKKLRTWKTLSRRVILDHSKYLSVESHRIELPDGEIIEDWPWVIIPSAAIVMTLTDRGKFLCFRQVKYAVEGISLAPVGGMIEPGESPLEAAKRELKEETGYEADEWISFGKYAVDPNRWVADMHLFFAIGAKKTADADSDDLEDQELIQLSRAEIEEAMENGQFKVLAWIAVVSLAFNYLDRIGTQGS